MPVVIEIMTFRLRNDADEPAWRALDARVQVEFSYQQPGLLRRTLGRNGDRWLVLQVWANAAAAQNAQAAFDASSLGAAMMALVDRDTLVVERYQGAD